MTKPIARNYKLRARKLLRFLTTNELLLRQEIKAENNHIIFLEKTAESLNSISSSLRNLRKSNLKTYFSSRGSKQCQTLRSISPNSGCLTLQKPQLIAQKIRRATSQSNFFSRNGKKNHKSQVRNRVKSRKERKIASQSNFLFKSPEPPKLNERTNKKSFKFLLSKLKNIGTMGTIKASKETTSRKIDSLSKEIKKAKDRSEVRRKICKRIDVLVSKFDRYDENSYSVFKDTNDHLETDSIVNQIRASGQKKKINQQESFECHETPADNQDELVENQLKGVLSYTNLQNFDDGFGVDDNFSEVRNGLSSFFKESKMMRTSPRGLDMLEDKRGGDKGSRLSLDLNTPKQFQFKSHRANVRSKKRGKKRKPKGKKEKIKEFKNLDFFKKEVTGKFRKRLQRKVAPKLRLRKFKSTEFKFHSYLGDKGRRNNRLNLMDVLSNPETKKLKNEQEEGEMDQSRIVEENLEKRKLLIDKISLQLAELQGDDNLGYSFS